MPNFFLLFKKLLPFILIYITYYGCSPSTTGSESETEMEIALFGKVETDNKLPVKDVIVSLHEFGISDTTDSLGNYSISAMVDVSLINSDTITDTLSFQKDSTILNSRVVYDFVDTINIVVYQRDFVSPTIGTFPENGSAFLMLTTMDNGDTAQSFFELGFIESTKKVTGMGFFKNSSTANYSAYIKVFDKDGNLTGRSITNSFTSIFGQIDFPCFNVNNMRPVFTGIKNPLLANDTVVTAIRSFGDGDTCNSDSIFYNNLKELHFEIGNDSNFITEIHGAIIILDSNNFHDSLDIRVSAIFHSGDTTRNVHILRRVDSLIWDYNIDMTEYYGDHWGRYSFLDTPTTVSICKNNVYDGKYSIKLETQSLSDVGFVFPEEYGSIPIIDLKETDSITFWAYTENIGAGFKHQSPVIVLKSDEVGFDFMEFHCVVEGVTPFNESLGKWTYITIPLSGDSRWRKDIVGAASLSNVNQIKIKSVGLNSGYTIWIDKVIIKKGK